MIIVAAMVAIGLLMTGGGYYYENHTKKVKQDTRTIIVAAREIEPRSEVTQTDIVFKEVLRSTVNPLAIQDPGQIIGKIALSKIAGGEQFFTEKLLPPEMVLNPDERLVSVSITKLTQCVGNTIKKGDYVDVYFVTNQDSSGNLIAPAVRIADLRSKDGQQISPLAQNPQPAQSGVSGLVQDASNAIKTGVNSVPSEIILVVKTDQVPSIARAVQGGLIYLSKIGDINEAKQYQQTLAQQAQQQLKNQTASTVVKKPAPQSSAVVSVQTGAQQ